ncbi:MAG: glycoside hydrolase family 2, partial [Bacteroidales bacterium]|nr:glycoside hydrolase family 2 [Bacteroidales bacterium]
LRFFSGTATYSTSFRLGPEQITTRVVLDLGWVFNMAHVYVNGKDLGLLWKEPYKTDISEALVEGDNSLEIKVINSWGNRLIGDSSLPEEERAAKTSWEFYSPDDPLPVSGLLGPVRLLSEK